MVDRLAYRVEIFGALRCRHRGSDFVWFVVGEIVGRARG